MATSLNSRDLVSGALQGNDSPRVPCGPLAVHFCARVAGAGGDVNSTDVDNTAVDNTDAYSTDARVLADCVSRYWERYRPDAVWVSADTWVTAEAMGAEVFSPGKGEPLCGTGEVLVKSAADVDAIAPADPASQGRLPLMQEALRLVRQKLGEEVFVVGCFDQSPFTLACALMGIETVMYKLYDDLSLVEALLERCIEYGVAYGSALAECGADMLSTGDSVAGLIGPKFYREVALPAERRVFSELRQQTRVPLSLHICGNTTAILDDMANADSDVLEIDHQVDLADACHRLPPEIAIWGNLDPVAVLERGSVTQVEAAVRDVVRIVRDSERKRFVLSSGCAIAPSTPECNLRAFFEVAREL